MEEDEEFPGIGVQSDPGRAYNESPALYFLKYIGSPGDNDKPCLHWGGIFDAA